MEKMERGEGGGRMRKGGREGRREGDSETETETETMHLEVE